MMGGMLVAVEDFSRVDKAAQAVDTLFGVDPDFVTLCETLYGPDVDPAEVWSDVFKMNPTGPDSSVPGDLNNHRGRKRALEAAGIGATVIGGALGVKELKGSTKELRHGIPGKGKLWPAAKVGGVTAMLGGDAAATANQVGASRRSKQPVGKLAIPGVHEMAEGLVGGMKKLPGIGGLAPKAQNLSAGVKDANRGVGNVARAQGSRAYRTGQRAQGMASSATATPMRTIGTATAAGAAGSVATQRMRKRDDVEELDVLWAGEFSKFDEDKRLVFGWASVVELNGSPVVDRQGDYIHPDDLENASYEYVIKSRVGGDMHRRAAGDIPLKVSDLVESMVFTPEKIAKMGLPVEAAANIPTGWWVGFKVHDDQQWDMVKKRARTGFSIHGRGKRVPTSMDQLVPGYH